MSQALKIKRSLKVEVRGEELELRVPSALAVIQFQESLLTEDAGFRARYEASCELLRESLDDIEDYPVSVVVEIASKVSTYVILGDLEKKPETTL